MEKVCTIWPGCYCHAMCLFSFYFLIYHGFTLYIYYVFEKKLTHSKINLYLLGMVRVLRKNKLRTFGCSYFSSRNRLISQCVQRSNVARDSTIRVMIQEKLCHYFTYMQLNDLRKVSPVWYLPVFGSSCMASDSCWVMATIEAPCDGHITATPINVST